MFPVYVYVHAWKGFNGGSGVVCFNSLDPIEVSSLFQRPIVPSCSNR